MWHKDHQTKRLCLCHFTKRYHSFFICFEEVCLDHWFCQLFSIEGYKLCRRLDYSIVNKNHHLGLRLPKLNLKEEIEMAIYLLSDLN